MNTGEGRKDIKKYVNEAEILKGEGVYHFTFSFCFFSNVDFFLPSRSTWSSDSVRRFHSGAFVVVVEEVDSSSGHAESDMLYVCVNVS